MITLITGTPGSGKTLRAVFLITEALEESRHVFTNIDGIDLPGVNPAPDDWRETPEGSLVVYDEVQQIWPSTGKPGAAPDDTIRALEVHRHTGHDIIVITQHPTLVHHHVRKLVGLHIHVRRTSNAHIVTLFSASEVFDPKDKNELRNTDKQTWRYPKKLFSAYKSATAHTHKFKMPAKIKYLAICISVMVVILAYYFFNNGLFGFAESSDTPVSTTDNAEITAQRTSEASAPFLRSLSSFSDTEVSGCMVIDDTCRCWDSESSPLVLDNESCLTVSQHFIKR